MNIGVIGAGGWGTALAVLLAHKGYNVFIWVRRQELLTSFLQNRENSDYLPGVTIPENIFPSIHLEEVVQGKDLLVLAVPSHVVEDMMYRLNSIIEEGTIIVNVAKGLVKLNRVSEIMEHSLRSSGINSCSVAVLSGPNHAEEVSRFVPTATVISSTQEEVAEKVQDVFITPYFRVYINPDIIGVELGGALKNIIALGAGVCDGLRFGDNTKAALLTRGLAEITRLGAAMGAKKQTFSGLSGMGDLFVTCASTHSRNRYVGMMLGEGKALNEIISSMKMVAEGIKSTQAAFELSRKYEVDMPITREVYAILFEGRDPEEATYNLMKREKAYELEEDYLK